MKHILFLMMFVYGFGYAQTSTDNRTVVGVAKFKSKQGEESPYAYLVTEKVVEMLTNSKRFKVVDRTSIDDIHAELELQKSEAFMDSKNLVEQDVAVAAEKMITGNINKIPILRELNANGTVKGYKANVSFQIKVVDVATGLSTEASSFDGKPSDLMLSPESAVTQAMQSLQEKLEDYFRKNFPVSGKIVKIIKENKDGAEVILINAGKKNGVKEGDTFKVSLIEVLEGEILPIEIGIIKVGKLVGESFSECIVPKKIAGIVREKFTVNADIKCELIVK